MTAPDSDRLELGTDSVLLGFELFQNMTAAPEMLRLNDGDQVIVSYATEADMRAQLAKLAYAFGWDVEQEVVIPGWGRIDLVLKDPAPGSILIELKRTLTRPADIRKGFQQADGYGRWWTANRGEPAQVILSAGKSDANLIAPCAAVYPEVRYYEVGQVMHGLEIWGDPKVRALRAERRAKQLSTLLAVHRYAVRILGGEA